MRKRELDDRDKKKLHLHLSETRRIQDEIRTAVQDALDIEDIGELPLSIIWDAIMENVAKTYYNKGLADARRYIELRAEDIATLEIGY